MSDWWQSAVVYQIYPRSFQDSDGDGIGDLEGIRSRLDYLEWLGVDAIWLCPIYPSPLADVGYDVADHTRVAPELGTDDDFDRLLADAHARGIRVVLDLVASHTSIEHPARPQIERRVLPAQRELLVARFRRPPRLRLRAPASRRAASIQAGGPSVRSRG